MQHFTLCISHPLGMHVRPAGLMVKKNMEYESSVRLVKGAAVADGKKLFAVMGLGITKDDVIEIRIEGNDEERACRELKPFLEGLFVQEGDNHA